MAITYRKAGVDIDAGNELVRRIKKLSPAIGGFSGLFPLEHTKYSIVSSTDGVGTKLKVAFIAGRHDTVGIDLVAMNVNDLICCGAKPLFFLDYYACGKLDVEAAEQVVKGIVEGCRRAACVLLGGETAEMPGFYAKGEYDLAGFAVGIVEKGKEITGGRIRPGDLIVGLPSSGPHSNGYSLIRKVLGERGIRRHAKQLLAPTEIYVKSVLPLVERYRSVISAICHITGGGFYDNIERLLPAGCRAAVNKGAWKVPEIFRVIQKNGGISEREIYRVLNMGIGMALIVRPAAASAVAGGIKGARVIGRIERGPKGVEIIP